MDLLEVLRIISTAVVAVVVPVLAFLAKRLVDQQVELLRAQVSVLKETQYDKAVALLRAQREAFEEERKQLSAQLETLEAKSQGRQEEILAVRAQLESVERVLSTLRQAGAGLTPDAVAQYLAASGLVASGTRFSAPIDLQGAVFEAHVNLRGATFRAGIALDEAVLCKATFKRADMRGVDLSMALGDSGTVSPHVPTRVKGLK